MAAGQVALSQVELYRFQHDTLIVSPKMTGQRRRAFPSVLVAECFRLQWYSLGALVRREATISSDLVVSAGAAYVAGCQSLPALKVQLFDLLW